MMRAAVRLLCWVVVGLVAASVAGCGTAESRRARALERGQQYLDTGKLDKARVEFQNALQISPNDGQARYLNGLVQERLGNAREAAGFFQGAVDVNPDLVRARGELARIYLMAGMPERVIETLKPGLEKHPDDAVLLALRAAARTRQQDIDGAQADAERAYQLDPKSEDVIAVLAGIYSSRQQFDKARAVLERGVAEHAASVDLRGALADFYVTSGDMASAESTLRGTVALRPTEAVHRVRLAQFLSLESHDTAAEAVLREGLAALPRDRAMQGALVSFLAAKKGRPAAEAELNQLIAAGADVSAQFTLAQLYTDGGDSAKAEAVYREIVKAQDTRAPGLEARTRLAALLMARGERAAAAELLAAVLKQSPHDAPALELRASLELADDDARSAIGDLRAALRDQPTAAGPLRALARAHSLNGEPALAEEALRQAMDGNPKNGEVRIELAILLQQLGRPARALEVLEPFAKEHPADGRAQAEVFRAALAAKDRAAARAAADRTLAGDPRSALGHYFLGLLAEQDGRADEALREYDSALADHPDAGEALEAAVRLLVARRRSAEAIQRLDAAAARVPAAALPLTLKGEVLLGEKRVADAESAFRAASERLPRWWVPYRDLALAAFARGDRAGAFSTLADSVAKVDEPGRLRAEIASAHEQAGEWDEAIRAYDAMLAAVPRDKVAANNLAMLLANHRPDPAGLARAVELVKPFSSSPNANFLDTYGWVMLKRGDAKSALLALEKAQATAPSSPELRYHLAMAQLASGQRDKATDNLRQVLASPQAFTERDAARAALGKLGGA